MELCKNCKWECTSNNCLSKFLINKKMILKSSKVLSKNE